MSNSNPYAAPTVEVPLNPYQTGQSLQPASKGLRFANFFIDYIAQFAIAFVFGVMVVIVGGEEAASKIEQIPDVLLGIPVLFLYYFTFEATTNRTLGKLLTGTKVVNEDGNPPSIGQIAGRTLCRIIPFEAFSFLGSQGRGWHDSIPKTYVVSNK